MECGSNGCGDSCGTCPSGEICEDGNCVTCSGMEVVMENISKIVLADKYKFRDQQTCNSCSGGNWT